MNCFSELFVFCSKHQMLCPVQCKSIWKRITNFSQNVWYLQRCSGSHYWALFSFKAIRIQIDLTWKDRTGFVSRIEYYVGIPLPLPPFSLSLPLLFATLLVFSFSKSNSLLFFKYHAAKTTSRFASSVLAGRWLGGGSWIVWHGLEGLGLVERWGWTRAKAWLPNYLILVLVVASL